MNKHLSKTFSAVLILMLMLSAFPTQTAQAISPDIVISQVYGGGGNSGATYTHDFIELFNRGSSSVSLAGWSVQYASATGTGNFGANSSQLTELPSILLAPGQYLLIEEAAGAGGTTALPAPDVLDSTPINMSGTAGKVAVVNSTASLGCNGSSAPCSPAQLAQIVDLVGFGGANFFEGSAAAPILSNTTAAFRAANGCIDTDENGSDFSASAPNPRNTASPLNSCSDLAPSVSTTTPTDGASNVAINANIDIDFSEAVNVSGSWFSISCGISGAHTAAVSGGSTSFTLNPDVDFANGESCTVTVLAAQVTDQDANDPPDNMAANFVFSFDTIGGFTGANVVISQVYGGGGNSGATYKNDFIELYNRSASAVDITGWSVQYGSSGGTTWTNQTNLSGVIQPGKYFLIQEAAGAGGTVDLPTPNAIGSINMSGTSGKVALVNSTVALTGTGCPISGSVVDFVGYGSANCSETSPTATLSNTTAALRKLNGAQDTDNNSADFDVSAPNPRNTPPPDTAPFVSGTVPANGASNVSLSSDILITFNEPVGVTSSWFTISCDISGTHSAAVSGGPTNFTLNPDADFVDGDVCTLTVLASEVTDQDNDDPPDNMTVNFSSGFTTGDACLAPYTPIYNIQGSGLSAAITGTVSTQGVVVGDFEGLASVGGFFIQDSTGDGNAATSDGIFVYTGDVDLVSAGQVVRVTGYARERFNQTALNGSNNNNDPVTNIVNCGTGNVAPIDVTLPFPDANYPERFEGMYVRLPQSLVIAEYFNYDRFGEIVLAKPLPGETRPFTGTAIDAPGAPANARTLANSLSRITLDDMQSAQNPPVLRHPNGNPFSLTNRFRGGDTVQNTVGVLGFDFSLYRIFPTGPADYTAVNPRPASPGPVGGTVRVAAMNTLNFFVTLDPAGGPLDNKCGPFNTLECRGADDAGEFTRQRDKLLTALAGLNADIIGLNELENSTGAEPLDSITSGLPGYSYINTGTIGTDAIKVGLIYRSAVVTPVGSYKILNSSVDPRFIDTKSRPSLAQTFEVIATGARFTVVVNHLKSKGSDCVDVGDPDLGDGQGNCSQTRRAAAEALVDWIATDPTGSGDTDYIIMGDLNSYAREDTITEIKAGSDDVAGTSDDFTNLISHYQGVYAYSYTFDGQAGYLDHALANASLSAQITGAVDWHINSDEPDILDYDTTFKPDEQDALYEVNQYRTSDHDPVVVGMNPLHYNFTGFLQPVVNPPTLNVVKAGGSIPLKFSLNGDQGLNIFLNGYPISHQIACDLSAPATNMEQTMTTGNSNLSYDALTDQYTYVWKSSKSWAGTCRQLTVVLKDGSIHTANFSFK